MLGEPIDAATLFQPRNEYIGSDLRAIFRSLAPKHLETDNNFRAQVDDWLEGWPELIEVDLRQLLTTPVNGGVFCCFAPSIKEF
ncbi:hypothetical protein AUC70_05185 [Methyloceanibacter stevinii]|uniref:Uncharacterized protein n=1 Tax=Methyloceanibacter stevinii TaxID=1774970 RepID=A0A1E3VNK5_9HYPH|nr:hypothetical protein AUC70_05185 [Methyloceanibacter stevinii]